MRACCQGVFLHSKRCIFGIFPHSETHPPDLQAFNKTMYGLFEGSKEQFAGNGKKRDISAVIFLNLQKDRSCRNDSSGLSFIARLSGDPCRVLFEDTKVHTMSSC